MPRTTTFVLLLALLPPAAAHAAIRPATHPTTQQLGAAALLHRAAELAARSGLPDPDDGLPPELTLVRGLARIGDPAAAEPFLARLRTSPHWIFIAPDFAADFAAAGDVASARAILTQIPDPAAHAFAAAKVAAALYANGQRAAADALVADAEPLVHQLTDQAAWRPLAALGDAHAAAGDPDAARRDFAAAESAAESALPKFREFYFGEIAGTEAGPAPERAERIAADVLTTPTQKSLALYAVVTARLARKDFDGARRTARLMPTASDQLHGLSRVIAAELKAGDRAAVAHDAADAAAYAASVLPDNARLRSAAYSFCASAAAAAGDRAAAESAIAQIPPGRDRQLALQQVAAALSKSVDVPTARQFADRIDDPALRAPALAQLGKAMTLNGDAPAGRALIAAARNLLLSIADPTARESAALGVAGAQVDIGDPEAAIETLRSISPDDKAFAAILTRLGEAIAVYPHS